MEIVRTVTGSLTLGSRVEIETVVPRQNGDDYRSTSIGQYVGRWFDEDEDFHFFAYGSIGGIEQKLWGLPVRFLPDAGEGVRLNTEQKLSLLTQLYGREVVAQLDISHLCEAVCGDDDDEE